VPQASCEKRDAVADEPLLSLSQMPRAVNFKRTRAQFWRYCVVGIKSSSGKLILLESAKIGRIRYSSIQAWSRFVSRLQE
jgi:hypothetical protein